MLTPIDNCGPFLGHLLSDFVLGDRRLAERQDVSIRYWEVSHHPAMRTCESFQRVDWALPSGRFCFAAPVRSDLDAYVGVEIDQGLSDREVRLVSLLAALAASPQLTVAATRHVGAVLKEIGRSLQEVRESLGVSQTDIAGQVEVGPTAVAKWESGARFPNATTVYRWCQALGLVCPPNSALVRVVDFSPELLRFLQEDATRLGSLTPDQFERFVAERMDRMGYNVTLTGPTNLRTACL